jgi:hypothetical protein
MKSLPYYNAVCTLVTYRKYLPFGTIYEFMEYKEMDDLKLKHICNINYILALLGTHN